MIFDQAIALQLITFTAPLFALMWCAYKIEDLIDHGSRVSVLYYDWLMSGGRKIKELKVRAIETQYIDSQLTRPHAWRARQEQWEVPYRTRSGRRPKNYCLDELSEFLNFLKGKMSSVGPRSSALCYYELDLPRAMSRAASYAAALSDSDASARGLLKWAIRGLSENT